MDFANMQNFFNGNDKTPFNTKQPLNTPGGLGKEIKGNMQDTNILGHLETDYRGQMTDGKMFRDGKISHMIKLLTVKVTGDNPEQIPFHVICNTKHTQHWWSQTESTLKTFMSHTVTYIQTKPLTTMLIEEEKWQPSFTNIIEDVIEKCTSCQPKHVQSTKPYITLPKATDFNEIISVDLKE